MAVLAGCESPGPTPSNDDFVPFEGADVVKPGDAPQADRASVGAENDTRGVSVDRYLLGKLDGIRSTVPKTLRFGAPEVLWLDGAPGRRKGVAVILLVRNDVYGQPPKLPVAGPTKKLLVDLMASVGGHVTNQHQIPAGATSRVDAGGLSFAQSVYAVLKTAGLTGRIQNANRWVIGSFRESDKPVEAWWVVWDQLWEACDALQASQPVLILGQQVLNEDDLRLRRLYEQAKRKLDWPTYAGSAPDPGLEFSPEAPQR